MTKRILLIDDDEGIVDALRLILEDLGYSVKATIDGQKSIQHVREFKPDLIMLDVLMSGVDGRAICEKLKNDPETRSTPVIMISAHPTAAKGALECGAEAFIAKPFETDELIKQIEDLLV